MEEWECHVAKVPRVYGRSSAIAYCGETIFGFHFLDVAHAQASLMSHSRLQPCPACWKEMVRLESSAVGG
jgi:hypothetical protein